jgi:hypothetical protein
MELSFDADTVERFARGIWGLLNFIVLIVYLRWQGEHSSVRDEPNAKPPDLLRRPLRTDLAVRPNFKVATE